MITNDDTQPVTFAEVMFKKMLAILQTTSETLDGLCLTHNGSWCFSACLLVLSEDLIYNKLLQGQKLQSLQVSMLLLDDTYLNGACE